MLLEALSSLGIQDSGNIIVHSSFHRFGALGWTPEELIETIICQIGPGGNLVFPTMTWRTVTPMQPIFDESHTPGHVGVLAETFRTGYGDERSLHPTHSVAARGNQAKWLTDAHHLANTPCSDKSPYARLASIGGQALMLNVDINYCTALHRAEELLPDTEHFLIAHPESYTCVSRHGGQHNVDIRRHTRFRREFVNMEDDLARQGALSRITTDGLVLTRVNLAQAIDIVYEALLADPTALDP
jgi:aminoglycoside 3-N-acetyltransferase